MAGEDARLAAQLRVLTEMFRVSHNAPSTPERSLSGEVKERTIWGYWAQGYEEMPELFKLCVETWQRHNPSWDVRILQKSTVREYLSAADLPNRFEQMLSHQAASDCVRLGVLARYGGVYLDVNILLCGSLDDLCWRAISSGARSAAAFYHPRYGTARLGGRDFVESWCMATKPGHPFFLRWRDLLRELLHNRLDTTDLLAHPLYRGLDLSGFERLNLEFGADFDFREYLFIHAMCHRVLETDSRLRAMYGEEFCQIDASTTAFKVQLEAERLGRAGAELLVSPASSEAERQRLDALVSDVPLVKLRTPDYGPLLFLPKAQLLDRSHLLGRLLTASPSARRASAATAPPRARPLSAPPRANAAMAAASSATPASASRSRPHATLRGGFGGGGVTRAASTAILFGLCSQVAMRTTSFRPPARGLFAVAARGRQASDFASPYARGAWPGASGGTPPHPLLLPRAACARSLASSDGGGSLRRTLGSLTTWPRRRGGILGAWWQRSRER